MRIPLRALAFAPAMLLAVAAAAQDGSYRAVRGPAPKAVAPGPGGPYPLGYDTGGGEDRRPELKPYQQGGGQQTGGPARNLIPGDNLHISPR